MEALSRGLSPAQSSQFLRDGYLVLAGGLSPNDLEPFIDEITAVLDKEACEVQKQGRLPDLFEDQPFETRLARIIDAVDDGSQIKRAVTGKHLKTAGLFAIITQKAILDTVESVIGPELLAHPQYNLQAKMPMESRSEIPWHQDLAFLEPEAAQTSMVNFWIPLVDTTVDNGCLEVIEGSHLEGLKEHVQIAGYPDGHIGIREEDLPAGRRLACPARRGDVVVFQHKTIHRSYPNRTSRIRWSLDIRYCDPTMPTGRDVPGLLVRSKSHPEKVAVSHLEWLDLMKAVPNQPYLC